MKTSWGYQVLAGAMALILAISITPVQPAYAAVFNVSGAITSNTTWTTGNIYVVQDNVTVNVGVTLTVQPGVIVKFAGNKLLGVNGVLRVEGSAGNPVILTSLRDDTAGGDTNGDGNSTAPAAGDWGHIAFFDSSVDGQNLIEQAVIRYGGSFDSQYYNYYNCHYCKYLSVIRLESSSPTVRNATITQNTSYAFSATIDSFPVLSGNALTLNQGNGLEIRGGTLSAASPVVRHWSNTDIVYALTNNATIASGVTLAIDPGVIVKVATNKLLGINGVLKVQGAAGNPVILTSLKDDTVGGDTNGDGNATAPAAGDWGHIGFFDTSVDSENLIEYAVIRFGGSFNSEYYNYYNCHYCQYTGALRFDAASPTVRQSTITQNTGYAFSAAIDSFPVITTNALSLNQGNGLEIRGGTLSAPSPIVRHWSNTDVVYVLTDNATIASGVTLAIDPGVTVKVALNKLIGVNGVLKVQGVVGNPVTITSLKDDAAGGDTNGDGNATAPTAGDWGHIAFLNTSVDTENLIEYAVIRYGGLFLTGYYDYYNCHNCTYAGALRFDAASPTVHDTSILLNTRGLVATNNAVPTLHNNLVFGNAEYGAFNESAGVTLDMTLNWWGAASGPFHPTTNPTGQGNRVGDRILYSPWNTSVPATQGLVRPGLGGAVFSPDGSTVVVFATDAVATDTLVTFTVVNSAVGVTTAETGVEADAMAALPAGLAETGHTFRLSAQTTLGGPAAPPGLARVRYTAGDLTGVANESSLALYRWTGSTWVKVTTTVDVLNNLLTAAVTADGTYAVLGLNQVRVLLPFVRK